MQAPPSQQAHANRVALSNPVFISDLHLSEQTPRSLEAFVHFIKDIAPQFSELLILGDLFEVWIGDDAQSPVAKAVIHALAELHRRGIQIDIMHGNRDVLIGQGFCEATGARLLADPTQASIGHLKVLLSHGDAWCLEDTAYQAFRQQVRNPTWQSAFLSQSREQREAFARQARAHSEAAKQGKSEAIMDVSPEAITQAFIAHGVTHIIHGHTHRCARHDSHLQGLARQRWVLPDWDFENSPARGGYLRVAGGEFVLESLATSDSH